MDWMNNKQIKSKIRTTITIDKELLNIAHNHKIRISTFLDNNLSQYLSQINGLVSLRTAEVSGSNPDKPITFYNKYFVKLYYLIKIILMTQYTKI
jgi:hypothetical protein